MLVEAAVESSDAALAAQEGGAHRIEWCTNLAQGGTTPPLDTLPAVSIPIFVLIRPRAGDFVYTDDEHRLMLDQIERAKAAGARGIVSGALTPEGEIDVPRVAELIGAARPLSFTFHRAIEACPRLDVALETLIRLGVDRVLTSVQVRELVLQARGRIRILAGGGIDATNAAQVVRDTGVQEIHFSVKHAQKVRDVLESL